MCFQIQRLSSPIECHRSGCEIESTLGEGWSRQPLPIQPWPLGVQLQSFDQEFEKMNLALKVSCIKGLPVRVVRSFKVINFMPHS
jgi:hypothetical protein